MSNIVQPEGPEFSGEISAEDDEGYALDAPPQYGYFGFTLREILLVAVWLIAFVVSFFPLIEGGSSVWNNGLHWVLTIGVPTVAVFLIVLRRFSPDGIRRVGSLGIDQFASVAASVAAVVWAQHVWDAVSFALGYGVFPSGWVMWVQLACALGLVVLTVAAPLIPGIREDFEDRIETVAHRNANPVRPVVAYPAAVPAVVQVASEPSVEEDQSAAESVAPTEPDVVTEVQDATQSQPFWALAPEARDVHDAQGTVVFEIGPDAWILVIEDRGGAFVVRHEDGRVGYLHDTTNITRG